jgi:hypothetical protein
VDPSFDLQKMCEKLLLLFYYFIIISDVDNIETFSTGFHKSMLKFNETDIAKLKLVVKSFEVVDILPKLNLIKEEIMKILNDIKKKNF